MAKKKAFKDLDVEWTHFSLQQNICYPWVDHFSMICLWMRHHKVRLKHVENDFMVESRTTTTFVLITCTVVRYTGHTHTSPHIRESKIPLHESWESKTCGGLRILGTRVRTLCQWNLNSWLQPLVRFRIPWAIFWIPKTRIRDSKSKKFPDSFTSVNAPTFIFHLIMMTPGYKFRKTMKTIDEQQCPV